MLRYVWCLVAHHGGLVEFEPHYYHVPIVSHLLFHFAIVSDLDDRHPTILDTILIAQLDFLVCIGVGSR